MQRRSLAGVALAFLALGCGGEKSNDARDAAADAVDAAEDEGEPSPDAATMEDALPTLDAGTASGVDASIADASASDSQRITVRFQARIGGREYGCDQSYAEQGSSKIGVNGRAFRFFVHGVRLLDRAGREVEVKLDQRAPHQNEQVGLLDFQDPRGTCGGKGQGATQLTGTAPAGDYKGLLFEVGVPEALNHADPALAPEPLRSSGMSWGWLLGYRFLVAELAASAPTVDAGSDAGADAGSDESTPGEGVFHLGSTGCLGSPAVGISCSKPNRPSVRLPEFDPNKSVIVADLSALFAGVDIASGVQCHARGDFCLPLFQAVGLDLSSGAARDSQRLFRVE